jgi:hypothetical protein
MAGFKPVCISPGGFAFCRTVIALLVVASLWPAWHGLLLAVSVIMAVSACLRVRRAPLIFLYRHTVDRFKPSPPIIVDENGIFFSHVVGTVFALLCWGTFFLNPYAGYGLTILFALLQISAACGFCSALKLYTCMAGGTCCRLGNKAKKIKDYHV